MRVAQAGRAALLALAFGCGPALANDIQVVPVPGLKKPDMRNYRSVVAGLDHFEENRSLAPKAALHFRLVSNNRNSNVSLDGVSLKIVGDGEPVVVPVAADGLMTMPRIEAAYDSDALVLLNRTHGQFYNMPDIRTPGLPDNVRRLGDLRLECQVMFAVLKKEIGLVKSAIISTALMTRNWCGFQDMDLPIWSPKPVKSAMLIYGERKAATRMEGDRAKAPLGDKSWPDDTLIEMTFETSES
jgi:hypothetical protein